MGQIKLLFPTIDVHNKPFVATEDGVGFENVAVAVFLLFQNGVFYDIKTAVVGEYAKKNGVVAIFGISCAELDEVPAKNRLHFFLMRGRYCDSHFGDD